MDRRSLHVLLFPGDLALEREGNRYVIDGWVVRKIERLILTVTFYLESIHAATPQLSSFHNCMQKLSSSDRNMNPQCNETPNEATQTPALKAFSVL